MSDDVARRTDFSTGDPCGAPPRLPSEYSPNVIVNDANVHRRGDAWVLHACPSSAPHSAITLNVALPVIVNDKPCGTKADAISCGSTIATGSSNVFAGSSVSVGGVNLPPNQVSQQNAQVLITELGYSAIDDEYETNDGQDVYPPVPQTTPPGPITETPVDENDDRPTEVATPVTDCSMITTPVDYNFQLSPNFKLAQLSTTAVFPHSVKAQNGLSLSEIVCNLKALAEHVLEPIVAQYPGARVNSGFRTRQNGRSQHEKGQAVDLQWPGMTYNELWAIVNWVKDNINYDQLLWEHGNSPWIHVSFNTAGNRPKTAANAVMTMYNNKFSPGLKKMQ